MITFFTLVKVNGNRLNTFISVGMLVLRSQSTGYESSWGPFYLSTGNIFQCCFIEFDLNFKTVGIVGTCSTAC